MCEYKYLFYKHMLLGGWGGGRRSETESEIYYRGAPCIGEGSGDRLGPQQIQGSPEDDSLWSSGELGIWGAFRS